MKFYKLCGAGTASGDEILQNARAAKCLRAKFKILPSAGRGTDCLNRANLASGTMNKENLAQQNLHDALNLTRRSGIKI